MADGVKRRKAVNSKNKGSAFEREICKRMSLWWTDGESDAIFHRSVTSGGFATSRTKQGKESANAYGDISYLEASGKPLLDTCCFELKCGYGKWDALDLLEDGSKRKESILFRFWKQACEEAEAANAEFPLVIAKRDRRPAIIIFPRKLYAILNAYVGGPDLLRCIHTYIGQSRVVIMLFQDWLEYATSSAMKLICRERI